MKNYNTSAPDNFMEHGAGFARQLLHWNRYENNRQMPWKGERDPYRIWLSEIMLQQTRVEQGLPYYQRFVEAFPTIRHLADAPDQQVFKLWEGLGYYSRCRNLLATARHIAYERGGVFPSSFAEILSLKGVGPYTAAAIASFAYNLPHAVLDGNVYRVLSRIHGISVPTDSTEGKKLFALLAQQQLPEGEAAAYNQAIMDFGAIICKPVPECGTCFYAADCTAYKEGKQLALPVKEKQLRVAERFFFYLVIQQGNEVALRQRQDKDVWQSLYEFLLFETSAPATWKLIAAEAEKAWNLHPEDYERVGTRFSVKQRLTHQIIKISFEHIKLKRKIDFPGLEWVALKDVAEYPFPKSIKQFIIEELMP